MKDINDSIINLWRSTPDEYLNGRMPFLLSEIKKDRIIFVGINPSFSERGFSKPLEKLHLPDLDITEFYTFPESAIFDIDLSLQIEQETKGSYHYFNKFKTIADSINLTWDHIDLFYIRETKQEDLKKYIFSKKSELNDFGKAQFEITRKVIDHIEPKVLVVANALASEVFKSEYNLEFNETYGCYFTEVKGQMVPTFLSSMVSGRRALDRFSYERLCWHIKKVLTDINNKKE